MFNGDGFKLILEIQSNFVPSLQGATLFETGWTLISLVLENVPAEISSVMLPSVIEIVPPVESMIFVTLFPVVVPTAETNGGFGVTGWG